MALVLAIVAALAVGARRSRTEVPVREAPRVAPGDEIDAALDRLEERLLADQARVRFWRELRERHESVSAIAAVNLERHAAASSVLAERQREKSDAQARRHRLASRAVEGATVTR